MPELPEVETVKRGLNKLIVGKTITNISFDWPKSFPNSQDDIASFAYGAKVINVRRRAKVLMIDLSTNYTFVIHLKMTGQLVYVGAQKNSNIYNNRFGAGHPNDSLIGQLPDKSTRVITTFNDGSVLYFNDQRKFGWMKFMPTAEVKTLPFFVKVGPEPLEDTFCTDLLKNRLLKRPNTTIKAALLDQSVLAGIGNIYADESLFGASIHPASIVKKVPKKHINKLHKEIIDVLNLSIAKGGSTDKNYVNAEGKKGSYITFAKVFRKEGQLCINNCGNIIVKTKVAGRGTHICKKCQKKYI